MAVKTITDIYEFALNQTVANINEIYGSKKLIKE